MLLLGLAAWALDPHAATIVRIFDAALPDSAPMSSAPDVGSTGYGTSVLNLTVAANGDFVVYPVRHGDSTMLWYRSLIDASAHPIGGTAGGTMPRISPDGSRLAFISANRVMVVPVRVAIRNGSAGRRAADHARVGVVHASPHHRDSTA